MRFPGYETQVTKAFSARRSGLPVLRGDARLQTMNSAYLDSANPNSLNPGQARSGRTLAWLQSASAEVWTKFLLALVGLGLAFGAALFSTASGEAGHLWASVISGVGGAVDGGVCGAGYGAVSGAASGAGAAAADFSL